jgi:hypothetical protein
VFAPPRFAKRTSILGNIIVAGLGSQFGHWSLSGSSSPSSAAAGPPCATKARIHRFLRGLSGYSVSGRFAWIRVHSRLPISVVALPPCEKTIETPLRKTETSHPKLRHSGPISKAYANFLLRQSISLRVRPPSRRIAPGWVNINQRAAKIPNRESLKKEMSNLDSPCKAKSAAISPTALENLKPCPEQGLRTMTFL